MRASIGLGYRKSLHAGFLDAPPGLIDFVELSPENYLVEHEGRLVQIGGERRRRLEAIQARYPILCHGLSLSLGGPDPLDPALLDGIAETCERLKSPHHSDHLCWSSAGGAHLHELLPLPFTRATARAVAGRVREVQHAIGRPFAVENVSAYLRYPEDEWSEGEWVTEVVEQSGGALMLDVNNVLVNALNFGRDPFEELARFPLERTLQIHVAGYHRESADLVIDTHGAPMDPRIHPLLAAALRRTGPVPILLERDNHIPPFADLVPELIALRETATAANGATAATAEAAHVHV